MDGKPVAYSQSMLLVAVDKAENTGTVWNADRTMAPFGEVSGPVLCTGVEAQFAIDTTARSATVWALDNAGRRLRQIPSDLRAGSFVFI